jgi:hypothetical protein
MHNKNEMASLLFWRKKKNNVISPPSSPEVDQLSKPIVTQRSSKYIQAIQNLSAQQLVKAHFLAALRDKTDPNAWLEPQVPVDFSKNRIRILVFLAQAQQIIRELQSKDMPLGQKEVRAKLLANWLTRVLSHYPFPADLNQLGNLDEVISLTAAKRAFMPPRTIRYINELKGGLNKMVDWMWEPIYWEMHDMSENSFKEFIKRIDHIYSLARALLLHDLILSIEDISSRIRLYARARWVCASFIVDIANIEQPPNSYPRITDILKESAVNVAKTVITFFRQQQYLTTKERDKDDFIALIKRFEAIVGVPAEESLLATKELYVDPN